MRNRWAMLVLMAFLSHPIPNDARRASSCAAGTYAYSNGDGQCRSCEEGKYAGASANACTICAAGKYTDQQKQET